MIKTDKGQNAKFTFNHLQASGKGLEGINKVTKSKALITQISTGVTGRLGNHDYQMMTADIIGNEILCANFYFTSILPYFPDKSKQLMFGSVIFRWHKEPKREMRCGPKVYLELTV